MLYNCKNNTPAAINWTCHIILSIIIKLGLGIEEMPEMEEHTCKRNRNLIARLMICDSETCVHIIFQFDSGGLKMGNLTNFIILFPFLSLINSTALLGEGFILLFQKHC